MQIIPILAAAAPLARRVPPVGAAVAALFLTFVIPACSLFASGDATIVLDPDTRIERIQALQQAIADDHATLEELITSPRESGTPAPHLDPELRTIANRLGENERELTRLQALALEDAR